MAKPAESTPERRIISENFEKKGGVNTGSSQKKPPVKPPAQGTSTAPKK
jgi:hypothetical protein